MLNLKWCKKCAKVLFHFLATVAHGVFLVEQATDVAEFLSGAEQDNAQHIVIKYKTDDTKNTSRGKETERNSMEALLMTERSMKTNRSDALSYVAKHGRTRADLLTFRDTSRHVKFDLEPAKRPLASSSTNLSVASPNVSDLENESGSKTKNMKGKRVTKNLTENSLKKHKGRRTKGLSKSMDEEVFRGVLSGKEGDLSSDDKANMLKDANELKIRKKRGARKAMINSKSSGKSETVKSQNVDDLNLNLSANEDEGSTNGSGRVVVPPLDLDGLDQAVTPRTPRSILRYELNLKHQGMLYGCAAYKVKFSACVYEAILVAVSLFHKILLTIH